MRLKLLLGFMLDIVIVLGIAWLLAVRTTDSQFDVLVTRGNQHQARLLAPSLMEEYARTGDWQQVQENLHTEIAEQDQFTYATAPMMNAMFFPERPGAVVSLNVNRPDHTSAVSDDALPTEPPVTFDFNLDFALPDELTILLRDRLREQADDRPYYASRFFVVGADGEEPRFPQAIVMDAPSISWTVGNIMLGDQRVLVVDSSDTVVVDTKQEMLGRQVPVSFNAKGIPLLTGNGDVSHVIITSSDGVYTLQQSSFLHQVRRGFLYGGLISAAVAFIFAFGYASEVTRPIRMLTAATTRLQAGEWGYTVKFKARNEIGQLADAFNEMSSHLAEQRSLRRRLIDDLAHELNTPLSLMHLELQGMADGLQSPAEAATNLHKELAEVTDLVADLVFLANRDATPAPTMDWLDLNSLVESTVKRFENSASQQQNQTLSFTPQPVPPIYGDPYLVQRAISNLLANAIRYTPSGGTINVSTCPGQDSVEVHVTDSGAGIAPEHLPHIFERFYRADDSRTRQSGGRGLGLAIVRQIMDQHGGDVRVESNPGSGSTFTLYWKTQNMPS